MIKHLILACAIAATGAVQAGQFELSSPQIKPGATLAAQQVFKGFGCDGGNISPALSWSGAPAGTKSFAVTMYDPDAPTGSGWWHWVVFNLPADTHDLKPNAGNPDADLMPPGAVQSRTDYNRTGYGGPCPPVGDKPHHYVITVYALKINALPLDETAPAAMVGYYLHQNMLGKAVLTGRYGR